MRQSVERSSGMRSSSSDVSRMRSSALSDATTGALMDLDLRFAVMRRIRPRHDVDKLPTFDRLLPATFACALPRDTKRDSVAEGCAECVLEDRLRVQLHRTRSIGEQRLNRS